MTQLPKADITINLKGLKCPLPVLRTKKSLSKMVSGQILEVLTTDPNSAEDIPAFAKMSGHQLINNEATTDGHRFFLRCCG